jgi:4-amino-4-deoxy-L-arabinose transferase-like glycosyltransferase
MLPRLKLPPHPAALALLAAAFILPGLAGHDPWKTHDAVGIGIIHTMATSGELLVPRVAGTLWLNDPPLYHWIATAFGLLLQPLLQFHAGARMASGALVALAFWLVYRAGRAWAPEEELRRATGSAAMLLVLGAVGLMVHAHDALPELASLAAVCGALLALTGATRRPLAAGAAFGVALGLSALASTWMAPAALAAAAIAARFVCPQWREAPTARFLLVALPIAVVLAASWPYALSLKAPQTFSEWRHLALPLQPRPLDGLRFYLTTLSWFTWPAWPLALWAAWGERRPWREPRLFIPAAATVLGLAGLAIWGPTDDVDLIPLLAPLALFAAQAIFNLRRGAAGALDWFGVLVFAFFSLAVWFFWFVLAAGLPAPVARNMERIAPGYVAQVSPLAVLFALALAVAWVYLILRTERSPVRSLVRWAGGIVLLWGTAAMLLMPWVDYQKTYRSVALELRSSIPADAGCIAQKGLGVSQAASLDYHAGIRPRAFEPLHPDACRLLIVQGGPKEEEFDVPGRGWTKLAEVGRPGDRVERYRLYRRGR